MAASPYPLANLPDAPTYRVEETGPAYVIEVVVPFNEGTIDQAVSAARDVVASLTVDEIPGAREAIDLSAATTLRSAKQADVIAALIFG